MDSVAGIWLISLLFLVLGPSSWLWISCSPRKYRRALRSCLFSGLTSLCSSELLCPLRLSPWPLYGPPFRAFGLWEVTPPRVPGAESGGQDCSALAEQPHFLNPEGNLDRSRDAPLRKVSPGDIPNFYDSPLPWWDEVIRWNMGEGC